MPANINSIIIKELHKFISVMATIILGHYTGHRFLSLIYSMYILHLNIFSYQFSTIVGQRMKCHLSSKHRKHSYSGLYSPNRLPCILLLLPSGLKRKRCLICNLSYSHFLSLISCGYEYINLGYVY